MEIIFGAVVGLVPFHGRREFRGQRVRPFLPGEMPLGREADRERECLRLPGFCEHGTLLVTRQVR